MQQHFCESFWNETPGDFTGWENIVNVLKGGRQNLKHYMETLRQRAEIEESYGKSLLKLARGMSFEKDVGPLDAAWTSYRQQTEVTADAHLKTARDLNEEAGTVGEICARLRDGRRFREESVRQCQQKLKQDFRRSCEARKLYESRCSDEISSSQTYHKEVARCGKRSREADKAKAKFDRSRQSLRASELAYRQLVFEAEDSRLRWQQETLSSLQELQSSEEERLQCARDSLWAAANAASAHSVKDDAAQEELRRRLERCGLAECLLEVTERHGTGEGRPGEICCLAPLPDSSHYGLSPASSNSSKVPPKPPRLIHYASSSSPSWQQQQSRCYDDTPPRFPIVDSVDNIEYFNLSDPVSVSTSSNSDNSSGGEAQSISEFRYPFLEMEKRVW